VGSLISTAGFGFFAFGDLMRSGEELASSIRAGAGLPDFS
jgi:hypothetical protein